MPIHLADSPKAHKFFLGDFVSIQRNSFLTFLEKGLIEEFSKRNPITNASKTLEVFFYPEYYQLTKPTYSTREAILKGKSYSSRLYIPVQLTDQKSRIIQFKWVYIADLPIMTKRGHFIINGAPRVIINQIIRSPGIYYQTQIYENFKNKWAQKAETSYERYYADLICQRGTWLRLEIDRDKKIWAQTKKGPKVPILWLLIAMGLTEKIIFKSVMDPSRLLYNMLEDSSDNPNKAYGLDTSPEVSKLDLSGAVPKKKTGTPFGSKKKASSSGLDKVSKAKKPQSRKVAEYIKTPPEAWAAIYSLFTKVGRKSGKKSTPIRKTAPEEGMLGTITQVDTMAVGHKNLDKLSTSSASMDNLSVSSIGGQDFKEDYINTNNTLKLIKSTGEFAYLSELGRQFIFNKFMNPRTYDLSKQGRLNFNKKLNLSVSPLQTTLTPQDILAATDYLLKVEAGLKKVDDIDHLKNRRVRTSGELIQIQLGIGLVRLEKTIRDKIKYINYNLDSQQSSGFPAGFGNSVERKFTKTNLKDSKRTTLGSAVKISINSLINTKAVNSVLREFFGTSPLSQFMDQINPLAELTHKRRLSSMGPGGVTRDSATLDIRGIHPSHYGRICPVETPEGKNTGLVNSLTTYARVNAQGYIETPFYRVYKGQVQKNLGMYFFSAEHEAKIKLGAADLSTSEIGFLSNANIPVRIQEEFSKISRNFVEYVGVSPSQMVSIATSLIPFLEHDDANRALMGSNMQRQAVPLLKAERPIVGTGLEARAVSDSGHALQARKSSLITYVSADKIILYTSEH